MKNLFSKKKIGRALLVMLTATMTVVISPADAAKNNDDIDELIIEHEALIQNLKNKRTEQKAQEKKQASLEKEIENLNQQLANLQKSQKELGKSKEENEQAQRTIQALTEQIDILKRNLETQQAESARLMKLIETLENAEKERKAKEEAKAKEEKVKEEARQKIVKNSIPSAVGGAYGETTNYNDSVLVNPGPVGTLNYTQDAKNAQGKSVVIFSYAPNQMYKIYCRVGFLTDIVLKKGEKVSFVGGGDTAAWALDSSTIDGATHIYIKPTVDTSATNLIINTNKRSYHLLLNTSASYNPMVTWTYGQEDRMEALKRQEDDEKAITSTVKGDIDSLNFNYSISGSSSLKPDMVFDDGEKTFIRFKNAPSRIPTLFVKEIGKKDASLVNYKIKDKTYIIDRLVREIELRFSEDEAVKIKRKS